MERGCCFRWGSEQQERLCCRVSQILFPCRCSLRIKTYGKIESCNIDAVMSEAGKGQGEVGVALNSSSV